ncbi:YEATS family histone acetyltransferase subunit Yaf9 [Schizosaccharomyces japonicus yFS275]|uniref:Protein AF-9 homolog n=1 Tax=Schizosaccharomyces japonicus (strain yFS275 / FY16936) TaxID=402676 RepID=B6K5X2_SCHJY|nr:YEATS family histone acetyltransferase subunit Yaf9 [Schizosaccharomyces japonicus yFS275]EEB08926.1 YEATS family histone acetyltransferase subunit Yaf9 [Schizosaccharomyces japonicus yFS275]
MGIHRISKCQISRPIIVGNDAKPLTEEEKQNAPKDHTHHWRIFVEGVDGEDISPWIRKVVFKLHDTYHNSTRIIEEPPFEVNETGWGEFDIMIRVFFPPEAHEKPITFFHRLKLHAYLTTGDTVTPLNEYVKSEQYEEVVFNEPTEIMYNILTQHAIGDGHGLAVEPEPGHEFSLQREQDEVDKLDIAVGKVNEMIQSYRKRLQELGGTPEQGTPVAQ